MATRSRSSSTAPSKGSAVPPALAGAALDDSRDELEDIAQAPASDSSPAIRTEVTEVTGVALQWREIPFFSDSREARIAEAAYWRAERRGFAPGHELEDWLEAEKQIDSADGNPASSE